MDELIAWLLSFGTLPGTIMSEISYRSLRVTGILLVTLLLLSVVATSGAADLKTRNIVLITPDGLRWQEVVTGAEKALINKQHSGVADVKAIEETFWRETPEERRAALLPFFWNTIAREGQSIATRRTRSL
jgi:hypothetical protein